MECNKEEAVKAREIAEQKMQNGDFDGANRFALKAQKLFPELENISQLLAVCNVHHRAKNKLFCSEMDWYGILQVEQSADETFIKKHYRKLALLLHPDKNKFAGAEAAFKLIGEANMILSDKTKRSQYDLKCRVSVKTAPKSTPHQNGASKFTAPYSYQQVHVSFWTLCTGCGVKYQYYKDFLNKQILCPTCGSYFIACDLGPQGYSWNQNEVLNQGPWRVFSQVPKAGGSVQVGKSKKQNVDGFSNARDGNNGVGTPKPNAAMPKESRASRDAKKKRGRKPVDESDESSFTSSESETEDAVGQKDCGNNSRGANSQANSGDPPRRSSRVKQHISYKEKLADDDDDFVSPPKRSKVTDARKANEGKVDDYITKNDNPGGPTVAADEYQKDFKQKASKAGESKGKEEELVNKIDEVCSVNNGSESDSEVNPPQVLEYPDPEFSDFEKQRAENCFAVNQVWAIYDTCDGMPRFYARIKKVFNTGFKLRITWLEPDPDEENELSWVDLELPVSCSKYRNGQMEICVDRLMFSHRVDPIISVGKSFFVYPKKGETWALFRDWDIKWASEPENHKPPYRYDFVEVLTDYNDEIGIGVVRLVKVKGFVSIFQQDARYGVISFQVSPGELYRFSHQIPSFRMTGMERKDVPVGSFELDPASLPIDLVKLVDPGEDNLNQTKGNSTSVEKVSTPKKCAENDLGTDGLTTRRSPRGLSK